MGVKNGVPPDKILYQKYYLYIRFHISYYISINYNTCKKVLYIHNSVILSIL